MKLNYSFPPISTAAWKECCSRAEKLLMSRPFRDNGLLAEAHPRLQSAKDTSLKRVLPEEKGQRQRYLSVGAALGLSLVFLAARP